MSNYEIGDIVNIKTEDTEYTGTLLPSINENTITIKMKNGYNVGISKDKIKSIIILDKGSAPKYTSNKLDIKPNKELKNISIISTGGTVSSRIDYRTGAVHPSFTAEDLITNVPELLDIANIRGKCIMNILSENIRPDYWKKICEEIYNEVKGGDIDGIVITHGTDTMHYTAAALSFMIDTNIPIIMVGAQRSSDRPSSDGPLNLISSVLCATEDIEGVYVVMHGESGDGYAYLMNGLKVRKIHSSRRDAFKPINTIPVAKIYPTERKIEYLQDIQRKKKEEEKYISINTNLEEKVALIKIYPNIEGELIDYYVDRGYKGILLEGTGLGHAPESIFPNIKNAVDSGLLVAMTTQTINGRVNMNVYSNGRELQKIGVIGCEDMLPEVALIKMMYLLGNYDDLDVCKSMLTKNIKGEITKCSRFDAYNYY